MLTTKHIILILALITSSCAYIRKGGVIEELKPLLYVESIPILTDATNSEICATILVEKTIRHISHLYMNDEIPKGLPGVKGYLFVEQKYQRIPTTYINGEYATDWAGLEVLVKKSKGISGNKRVIGLYISGYMFITRYDEIQNFHDLVYIISHERIHSLGFMHTEKMMKFTENVSSDALQLIKETPECSSVDYQTVR